MITRMEITYRSKEPCDRKPEIFSTGGYEITMDGKVLQFDFLDMEGGCRFEDGYLYIDALQKNIDDTIINKVSTEIAETMLRTARKEDFTEIYYECFEDLGQKTPVELIPLEITFFDFSVSGDGKPIVVDGETFNML